MMNIIKYNQIINQFDIKNVIINQNNSIKYYNLQFINHK